MSVFNPAHLGPWAVLWLDKHESVARSAWAFFTHRGAAVAFRDLMGGELYTRQTDGTYKLA